MRFRVRSQNGEILFSYTDTLNFSLKHTKCTLLCNLHQRQMSSVIQLKYLRLFICTVDTFLIINLKHFRNQILLIFGLVTIQKLSSTELLVQCENIRDAIFIPINKLKIINLVYSDCHFFVNVLFSHTYTEKVMVGLVTY